VNESIEYQSIVYVVSLYPTLRSLRRMYSTVVWGGSVDRRNDFLAAFRMRTRSIDGDGPLHDMIGRPVR
jgi:hypothetical protein